MKALYTTTILAGVCLLWAGTPAFAQMPLPQAPVAPAYTAPDPYAVPVAPVAPVAPTAPPSQPILAGVPDIAARNEIIYRANLGRADDVKMLIEHGGSPNQMNGEGIPILSLAAARRDPEGKNVVIMLLQMGADLSTRDRKGQTALFYAAHSGAIDTLNVLMENEVDVYAIDNDGNTARSIAFNTGHKDVVQAIDTFISKPITSLAPAPLVLPPVYAPVPAPLAAPVAAPAEASTNAALTNVVPLLPAQATAPAAASINAAAVAAAASATAAAEAAQERQKILEQELDELKKSLPTRDDIKKMAAEISAENKKAQEPQATATASANKKTLQKQYTDDAQPPTPEAAAAPDASTATATATPSTIKPPMTDKEKEQEEDKRDDEIQHLKSELALNTCGYQYWYFCNEVKQGTELDSEESTIAINSYKNKAEKIKNTLIKKYSLKEEQFSSVVDSAQQRIYNQLNGLSSNPNRHENGVGKMDDMLARCGEIGRQWQEEAPGIMKVAPGAVPNNPLISPQNHKGGAGGGKNIRRDGAPPADNIMNMDNDDSQDGSAYPVNRHLQGGNGPNSNNNNNNPESFITNAGSNGKKGRKNNPPTPPLQGGEPSSGNDSVFK